jgi:hypothetical protein
MRRPDLTKTYPCQSCDGAVRHRHEADCTHCLGAGRVNSDGSPLEPALIMGIMVDAFGNFGGWEPNTGIKTAHTDGAKRSGSSGTRSHTDEPDADMATGLIGANGF